MVAEEGQAARSQPPQGRRDGRPPRGIRASSHPVGRRRPIVLRRPRLYVPVRVLGDGSHPRRRGQDRIDQAITFLEADPLANRSARVKGDILRRLSGAPLEPEQEARLRTVILRAVDAGDRREFKQHYRLARRLNNEDLRRGLIERLASENSGVRRRALWMTDRLPLELTGESRRF